MICGLFAPGLFWWAQARPAPNVFTPLRPRLRRIRSAAAAGGPQLYRRRRKTDRAGRYSAAPSALPRAPTLCGARRAAARSRCSARSGSLRSPPLLRPRRCGDCRPPRACFVRSAPPAAILRRPPRSAPSPADVRHPLRVPELPAPRSGR